MNSMYLTLNAHIGRVYDEGDFQIKPQTLDLNGAFLFLKKKICVVLVKNLVQ